MRFIETWIPATLVSDARSCSRHPRIPDPARSVRRHRLSGRQATSMSGVTIETVCRRRDPIRWSAKPRRMIQIAVRRADDSRGGSRYMWQLAPGARLDNTQPASLLAVDWSRENYCLIVALSASRRSYAPRRRWRGARRMSRCHYAMGSARRGPPISMISPEMLGDRLVVHASDEGQRLDLGRAVRVIAARHAGPVLAVRCACSMPARHAWIGAGHRYPISATRPSAPAARSRPSRFGCA